MVESAVTSALRPDPRWSKRVNGPERMLIWRVPGMATPADVESVRRIVNGIHDVELIAVDLPARLITVDYDPDSADPAEISAYLATSGYPVERPEADDRPGAGPPR